MPDKINHLSRLHEEIKCAMQKEVSLMREILANMNQEEVSLLLNDKGSWNGVMQQRYHLIERLSTLRSIRTQATQNLSAVISTQNPKAQVSIDQMLPLEDASSSEIFSLSDQILSLTERMNRQNRRNQTLSCQIEQQLSIRKESRYAPATLQPEIRPKRKNAVATYQSKH